MDSVFARRMGMSALLAAVIIAVPACSSSKATTKSGGGSADISAAQQAVAAAATKPTKISQTVALPSKAPSGKSVIFMTNGLPSTERIATGTHEAADALGWSFSEISYKATDPATLQSGLMNALSKKPSVVEVVGAPQSQFGTSTIAAYKDAKVPIIIGSVAPVQLGDPIFGTPAGAASEQVVGKLLADWFIADSGGKGKALVENATAYPVLKVFADAFTAEVSAACPSCSTKVVGITAAEVGSGALVPKVVAAARSNPSYKYVFFDNAQFADGILPAVAAAGLTGLKIGGRSIDPTAAAAVAAGTESVWTGQSYYLQGEAMVDVALRQMLGASGADKDEVIPVQLMTKQNISELSGQYNQPADSLAQFEQLWQVPVTACKLTCS